MQTLNNRKKRPVKGILVATTKTMVWGLWVIETKPTVQPKPVPTDYKPSQQYLEARQRLLPAKPVKRNIINVFHFHEIHANRLIKSIMDKELQTKINYFDKPSRVVLWKEATIG